MEFICTVNMEQLQHEIYQIFILYFFSDKVGVSLQNIPKKLEPSYKMDIDIKDCFGKEKSFL